MSEAPKSSDQMPEEAPAEQVPDDDASSQEGAAREAGRAHARSVTRGGRPGDGASNPGEAPGAR